MKPASAPPRSYGHRFELAEGISPRGLTCHCAHRALYFIFPAEKLPSYLSPATEALPRLFPPACFLPPGYFFNRPCGNQMGTKFGRWCTASTASAAAASTAATTMHTLAASAFFYHEVLGSKYVPCAVLFDLEPRVIDAVTEPHRREALPGEHQRLNEQRQRDVHTQERRHHHGGRERILHGDPQGGLHVVRGRRLRRQRLGLRTGFVRA